MSLSVQIRKEFPLFTLDVALEGNSETIGLLGASGSGKSMTLRCIAGLITPDSGRIVVSGRTFFDSEKGINLTPQQRKTALLFQNYQLFPMMTVAENIAVGMDRSLSKEDCERRVSSLLDVFRLRGFGKKYPSKLSGGQQQRVALARMLAAEPDILMLDEPFSALDEHLKACFEQELLDAFDSFHGTILYVSHDIDEAFRFCDRIAVIDEGSISDFGPSQRIVSHPKSLAALRLSGCKNISPARKIDDHSLFAENWGIGLQCDEIVPDCLAYVGLRAFHISPAAEDDHENAFNAIAARVSDTRFHRTVLLSLDGDVSHADAGRYLNWRLDKPRGNAEGLVERGDHIRVKIPCHDLHLVCG